MSAAAADFAQRHLRRNALALGADFALFMTGLAMSSQATIIPAFAVHLGAPNVVIAAIPAVMTLGWFLPALFAAGHTEALERRLPFLIRWTIWERVPYLVLGAAAFLLAPVAPALTLAVVITMLGISTGLGGFLMPPWMDLVGRAIPLHLRGRFFAVASATGNAGGLLAGLAATSVLATVPPPGSYGICFLLTAAFLALSLGCFLFTREPPRAETRPARPLRDYLAAMPGLLRRDANFSWYLTSRAIAIAGQMANGFHTVYALRAFEAPAWQAGVFTSVMLAGQVTASFGLGWVADRAGHRLALGMGVALSAAANLLAVGAPSLAVYTAVFALLGANQAALHVSAQTILLEFARDEAERPTYVGLGNTAMAPVALVTPFAAGALADGLGFAPVFLLAAAFGLAGLLVLALRVREPRGVTSGAG